MQASGSNEVHFLVGCSSGEVMVLKMDSTTVAEHNRLKNHASPISACASNSESIAATADASGLILLHDAKDEYEKLIEIKGQGCFAVTDMVMNDKFVIASYCTGHIRFYRVETGNLASEIAAHARAITALDLWENHVASVGEDTFLNVWSIPDSETKTNDIELEYSNEVSDNLFTGVSFLSNGHLATAATAAGRR